MDSRYDHKLYEENIYRKWEESNAFTPKVSKSKKSFTIIMPPPNANDDLHIGHARFVAIEDIIIRYKRMQGFSTLWLPGADHAGIETQYVFEKKLAEKNKSRFDYDRETLFKLIWDYVEGNRGKMEGQLRALGASCDWSRNKFTLDPDIVKIVYTTFKKLYDDGLVYRGEQIVNYCPKCGTAFSQLEVNQEERKGLIYYLNYKTLTIATTRPETIFADVAIAINPKDKRAKSLIGKTATIPIVGRQIPIITDILVDPKFGTGALKVTPGHDAVDFAIGSKHGLPIVEVIDKSGRMINTPEKYVGMKALAARDEIVKDLTYLGLLVKTEEIEHTVGTCYRCKNIIEPLILKQWFVATKTLAESSFKAICDGRVKFTTRRYEKIAKHWLKNLRDWNISRQIVWGMRIPAFRCEKCLEWTITEGAIPQECAKCRSGKLTQDTDTFDTWFSSGQWPYATLQSISDEDFNYFYPTSVMETAYDILPFWVLRMIMLGLYRTNDVPFNEVLIHGLVRDREGQKISKSKGNVINPLVMVDKYGSDALRMGITWGALTENDVALSEDNIRGQRNFANKMWNVARYVLQNEEGKTKKFNLEMARPRVKHEDDKWILSELNKSSKKITKLLDKYRLNEALEEVYSFIWKVFADCYLEKSKLRREDAQPFLEYVLIQSLKLAHPFMPFVTEAIWINGFKNENELLINSDWPKA